MGIGDNEFPVGCSLNNGNGFGWGNWGNWGGWIGGSGNPFMDIFAVTVANFRFTGGGSMWNGMFGGGMNAGFTASPWGGADYSFSTGSSSGTKKTADERIADTKLKNKHKALTDILKKYLATFPENSTDDACLKLDDLLKHEGKPQTQAGYDALKAFYNQHKDAIKTAILGTQDYKKLTSIGDGDYFNGESVVVSNELLEGDNLKSSIDVIELMGDFQKNNIVGFFFTTNVTTGSKTGIRKKCNKAIYNALKTKVEEMKGSSKLSAETKAALEKTLTIASGCSDDDFYCDTSGKPYKACVAMYYWLRIAQAEELDSTYACLSEDFEDSDFLGKNGGAVAVVKKDLHDTEHYSENGYCATQNYGN